MSLVYNNDKPIGKCESYSIDKVPGTTPFVMLTNYEPLRSELNENQQIVLDVLKKNANQGLDELIVGGITYMSDEEIDAIELSQQEELYRVLAAFAEWGMKEVAK